MARKSYLYPIHKISIHSYEHSDNQHLKSRDHRLWAVKPLRSHRAPSQYPKRRLSVRSRKVSKQRYLYFELSDRSEIWQALRQHCCRCACQISKRSDNLKYQSRGFEISRDLTKRRLFGYWDGALWWLYGRRCLPVGGCMLYEINIFHGHNHIWFR